MRFFAVSAVWALPCALAMTFEKKEGASIADVAESDIDF